MTFDQIIDLLTLVVAFIGISGALIGTAVAYRDLKRGAFLQSIRALHEAQLRVAEEVLETATQFECVETYDDLYANYRHFSKLKHGKALALLDEDVLNSMVEIHNAVVALINDEPDDEELSKRLRSEVLKPVLELTHNIRVMLSAAFHRESECDFSPIDCSYTQEWE